MSACYVFIGGLARLLISRYHQCGSGFKCLINDGAVDRRLSRGIDRRFDVNSRRISTALLAIAALTVLVVLAFRVRVGATADAVAVLKTTGMTCGSCSSKISRALEALKGVANTEVDVAGGWVIVGYDSRNVQPQALSEKVKGAGFGCDVYQVMTPGQFRQITGRDIGAKGASNGGCCGKGGCGSDKKG
jgi:periplasmic mercuric ion binding protein